MRTNLTRWTPETPRLPTTDPFSRLMEGFFSRDPLASEELSNRWTPAVDIRETDDAYMVEAELPGMTKDDIDITLENNMLRLRGERRFEQETEKESYHRVERAYGSFTRTFTLPNRVDPEKVDASFEDGILTVKVPKTEEARPRKISIH